MKYIKYILLSLIIATSINAKSLDTDINILKIDSYPTDGIEGVEDSLAYRVDEIEKHLHNRERWFGAAAAASGETHVADRMDGVILPFVLTAGVSDFGDWVLICGSNDTPVVTGNVKFDAHRFMVTATNSTSPYILQIVTGESADIAAKMLAGEFTEFPYISLTNNADSGIEDVMTRRITVGTKVWIRAACVGASGTTIRLFYGIHEYNG